MALFADKDAKDLNGSTYLGHTPISGEPALNLKLADPRLHCLIVVSHFEVVLSVRL